MKNTMKIGLFFGSFNPLHIGHLAIANYIKEFADLDKIWLVVSPQNPLKRKGDLLEDEERLKMVEIALANAKDYEASDVEFQLSKPSYTVDTLDFLCKKYPNYEFKIIMGSDNLEYFHRWKNYEKIVKNYPLIVYPRPTYDAEKFALKAQIEIVDAPQMDISSTMIRKMLKENRKIQFFLPEGVYRYIEKNGFYQ